MDEPLSGLKILADKLHVNGLMKIALYSKIARQVVIRAQTLIAEKNYTHEADSIRQFRSDISNIDCQNDPVLQEIMDYNDFYSLSECRDLLFHSQEHLFTLPQIEMALDELGLKFIGFELNHSHIIKNFNEMFPYPDAYTSLPLWHRFEMINPETFGGMYQFLVQKV